jgi:hypothetical protein
MSAPVRIPRAGRAVYEAVIAELKAVGLDYELTKPGRHFRLEVDVNGHRRRLVLPGSPSDRRSELNQVAFVRRVLRAEGVLS